MRFSNWMLSLALLGLIACSDSSDSGSGSHVIGSCPSSSQNSISDGLSVTAAANVMKVTVNGSLCKVSNQYQNEPCTSVTICNPNNANQCQTIDSILLDTGSYGLRIFSSVVTVPLTPVMVGAQNLAECVQFGDGSSEWGEVEFANVKLGGENAVQTPIQIINQGFQTPPSQCQSRGCNASGTNCTNPQGSNPDVSPSSVGFNGILGVGLFAQDCGNGCVVDGNNGQYYACSGGTCSPTIVPLNHQLQNPVALLPTDNNGVLLEFPPVAANGDPNVTGYMLLGIGTESNNAPPSYITRYPADTNAQFQTEFDPYSSNAMASFIDSGSSLLFFPAPTAGELKDCGNGTYCASGTYSFAATNFGASGSPSGCVPFQIADANSLLSSGSAVFSDLGGTLDFAEFDWGLPFFFGKSVYVGIENTNSSLGTGPYWGY